MMQTANVAGIRYAVGTTYTSVVRGSKLLGENRPQEALVVFEDAAARFERFSDDDDVRAMVALALKERAAALRELGRLDESASAVEDLVTRFGQDRSWVVREVVAIALVGMVIALQGHHRAEDQLGACEEVERLFGADPSPEVREKVAAALLRKAMLIYEDEPAHAMSALEHLLNLRWPEPTLNTRATLALASMRRATLMFGLGRGPEIIDACDELIRDFDRDPHDTVRACVAATRKHLSKLLAHIADPTSSFWEAHVPGPDESDDPART